VNPINEDPIHIIDRAPAIDSENGHGARANAPERAGITWVRLLWQERRFLGKVTFRGALVALLIAFLLPVRYESKARLMPPEQQSGSGLAMLAALAGRGSSGMGGAGAALSGSLGSVAGDLLGLKSSGSLFVAMVDGPTIQDDLIQKFHLRKVYWTKYWSDARKDLAKHTDVTEDRKSGVITIAVTDRDPHRAQAMAQAYVDALNQLLARVSTSSARRERIFLENRLKTVKQNLDTVSQQFSEYSSKNGTLDMPSQAKSMMESEATLEGQLIAAESELEGLRQIYTDNNIRVQTLQARVSELKRQVDQFSGNKANLSSGSSSSQIPGDFPSIRELPLVGVRWANLYRETKIQETIYELLTQEYELAKIQEAKEIPTINVLDAPLLPERKSFPPRTLITFLGAMLALLAGAAFVIGSAAWKKNQSAEKQLVSEIWKDISGSQARSRVLLHNLRARMGGRNGNGNGTSGKAA